MRVYFPPARDRRELPVTRLELSYERLQTTGGYVTLGDSTALVIEFAGLPDSIELQAITFGAIVQLTTRDRADDREISLQVNERIELRGRWDTVRARNLTPGSNAALQVIGKWARFRGVVAGAEPAPAASA